MKNTKDTSNIENRLNGRNEENIRFVSFKICCWNTILWYMIKKERYLSNLHLNNVVQVRSKTVKPLEIQKLKN